MSDLSENENDKYGNDKGVNDDCFDKDQTEHKAAAKVFGCLRLAGNAVCRL